MRNRLQLGVAMGWMGVLGLLLACAVAWAADVFKVTVREGTIRSTKQSFGQRLAVVHEGDDVTVLSTEDPWVQVDYAGTQGWLHKSAITPAADFVPSTSEAAIGAKGTEQSAAGRGFDEETERGYKASHPDLGKHFERLDKIVKVTYQEDEIVAFMTEGKLLDAGTRGGK